MTADHKTPSAGPEYWSSIVDGWARSGRRQTLWRRHSDRINTALIERWLPRTSPLMRVLKTDLFDEAVCRGLYPTLSDHARRVVGIDIAGPVIRAARSHHEGLLAVGADVRRLPFGGGSFDAVVSISTLDHFPRLEDISAGVDQLHRVLRPGGSLILTLDNLANPLVALRNWLPPGLLRRLGLIPYRMGLTCGPQHLREILTDAGFDIVEMTSAVHCPRVIAVMVAGLLNRIAPEAVGEAYLALLNSFERLAGLPTRYLTGYFIAVLAEKPGVTRPASG